MIAIKNNEITELLKQNIDNCIKMIDSLLIRRESGKLEKDEFNDRISFWDNKQYEYAKQLQQFQKL